MCPYWMVGDISFLSEAPAGSEHGHHHPQHNHSQNRDFFESTTAPVTPQVVLSAAAWLALLAAAARQEAVRERPVVTAYWHPQPIFPPPRFVFAA